MLLCVAMYLLKGDNIMSTITVRLNNEEEKLFKEYAEFKNFPLSSLLKEALTEKIEYDLDLQAILDYEERLKNKEVEYILFEDMKKRLRV